MDAQEMEAIPISMRQASTKGRGAAVFIVLSSMLAAKWMNFTANLCHNRKMFASGVKKS
jgi:hypothetical protein